MHTGFVIFSTSDAMDFIRQWEDSKNTGFHLQTTSYLHITVYHWLRLAFEYMCSIKLIDFVLGFALQYRIGQLYMISKHSHEQSDRGEGVEVVQNEPYEDPNHGNGQLTEKRVYLNRQVQLNCFSQHGL